MSGATRACVRACVHAHLRAVSGELSEQGRGPALSVMIRET